MTCQVLEPPDLIRQGLTMATRICHSRAVALGWWSDQTGQRIRKNKGELIALMHSKLSEALEGERRGLMDSRLPHRRAAEVELADLLIRVFDFAGEFGYDLADALCEKLAYNDQRGGVTSRSRQFQGGKEF